jgi:hypothetical protein
MYWLTTGMFPQEALISIKDGMTLHQCTIVSTGRIFHHKLRKSG